MQITALRSRVGTYHKGYVQGGAFCNSRMHVAAASDRDVAAASAHMFCEKCFPNGKPAQVAA